MPHTLVERAVALLCEHYVFPERAAAAAADVRARLAAGEYDGLDEPALAEALTARFAAHCADRHLRLAVRDGQPHEALSAEAEQQLWHERLRLSNHGIARVERLAGNIGYLDLRLVTEAAAGGRAIAAAMELVSHTGALLIDLRRNRGGSPDGVIFWTSYLFPDGQTHLNSITSAATGITRQYWSLAYLPGERYLDRPVWVLTSASTFSAGEELCYNLQAQGRAVLVGETTRGGAHPTDAFPVSATLQIRVPTARSVNPVTGTNWEGTGVSPDLAVPAERAYPVAYRAALEHVLAGSDSTMVRDEAREALAELG